LPAYAPRPTLQVRAVDTLLQVSYNNCGMWPDTLTAREKSQTERAIEALRDVPWAARLVREAAPLLQPMSQSARPQAKMGMPLETRFAYELHRTGRSAEYEHETETPGTPYMIIDSPGQGCYGEDGRCRVIVRPLGLASEGAFCIPPNWSHGRSTAACGLTFN
jgi:hypothetical protein